MSTSAGSERVLRPRASRTNLNGSAAPSSSSRVVEDEPEATSASATSSSTGSSTTTTTTLKTSADEAKARIAAARTSAINTLHDPAPPVEAYHRLVIAWLFLTVLLGTGISLVTSSSAVTAFRGRLPAPSNRITLSSTHLPGPLSGISLDYLLPSYFANKRNIFNVIFVKKAWGWTTLLWGLHWIVGIVSANKVTRGNLGRREVRKYIYRPVKRWALATIWWILFTQWAFGPAVSDRILISSGAKCYDSSLSSSSSSVKDHSQSSNPNAAVLEHSHCISPPSWWQAAQLDLRDDDTADAAVPVQAQGSAHAKSKSREQRKKAYWVGGHDLSGHAFLLTMSSLFLISEVAPTLSATYLNTSTASNTAKRIEQASKHRRYAALLVVSLVSLWFWMLLMTSFYFHTPQEKLSGFVAGVLGWWVSFKLAG